MVHSFAETETTSDNTSYFASVSISDTGERCLISAAAFSKGDLICKFSAAEILEKPSFLTLQIDVNQHILLSPVFLRYVNHSCSPNSFFDTDKMEFIALEKIEPGQEFRFFYPSTEWEMESPFTCNCKTEKCLGSISGAKFMNKDILKHYRITEFIKQQLLEENA